LPSRRVYIPKPNGGQRPWLGLAALEDKIVGVVEDGTKAILQKGTPQGAVISLSWRTSICTTCSTYGRTSGGAARPKAMSSSFDTPTAVSSVSSNIKDALAFLDGLQLSPAAPSLACRTGGQGVMVPAVPRWRDRRQKVQQIGRTEQRICHCLHQCLPLLYTVAACMH
jgi:hypothetical protein